MKKLKLITKILIVAFVIGLSLLVYPSFSNYWNLKHTTRVINSYSDNIVDFDEKKYENIWQSAVDYNHQIQKRQSVYSLPTDLKARYLKELVVAKSDTMGFIDIPKIGVSLPIYHGTSENVLQVGVGHLEWSSLPTGGESTHCVLSGHRGLPSAKLFSDLNKMREGDVFTLNILNEKLMYEVDQIRTVLPDELRELAISEGNDYCTLVTCTPYGINSHRLLVRGHRIENSQTGATVISEAVMVDQLIVAFYLAVPIIFFLFMAVMLKKPKKKAVIIPEDDSALDEDYGSSATFILGGDSVSAADSALNDDYVLDEVSAPGEDSEPSEGAVLNEDSVPDKN